jgi:glutaredoxin-like protein NrdH
MLTVTVYSTGAACMRCTLTCRCLESAGIPFAVIDLTAEENADHRMFVTGDLGYTEAPVVMVDDHPPYHWSGFRPDLIDNLAAHLTQGGRSA